jgi:serine/threonine protein kinase/Tfp pilus assembly protein PilF
MDSERWNQVDKLLQSALDRDAAERDAFVRHACGGDEQLEIEVRSLLAAHDRAGSFLGAPAIDRAARDLAERRGADDDIQAGGDPLIGQTFSHYRIVERLGTGGMGVVYKAEDSRLHRPVALKFISEDLAGDAETLSRFLREARTASSLNHPGICTIYDIGEQDGRSFITMEYLEGGTLKDRLAAGPLPLDTLLDVGTQIAGALDAAHAAGVVHRDIKPANIFISPRGHVTLLDFGLAKMRAPASLDAAFTTTVGTSQGLVLGTVAYMAPEQARGEPVDHRADIWSFGLVLYEMANGTRPAPAVQLRVEQSPQLEQIVANCLETDRALRYQHAADLRADLQRLKRESDPAAGVGRQPFGVARARWSFAAGAAAAIALGAAGYIFYPRAPALTDKDTIVLADFANSTGDPVFDDTLRQGLAVQLQQSPFLSVVSDQRIRRMLPLMNQPADARLTPDLAQAVCVRTASAAVLEGSIATLGTQYVLALRAKNCATGDILADEQAQAGRKEDVLGALSRIAVSFRTRVGESLETIEQHSTSLDEATTPSLDAWKAYTTASRVYFSAGTRAAQPLFQRAIDIDPDFAMAHARLGIGYSALGESTLARESTLKAYQLSARASDVERFFIKTLYDRQVTGNLEREHQTLESWADTYPRDPMAPGLLSGLATIGTGRYELSIAEADKAIAMDPDLAPPYATKAFSQLLLNRLADAEITVGRATERKLEFDSYYLVRYFIAFLREGEQMEGRPLAKGKAFPEDMISHLDALARARSGRLEDARRTSAIAVEVARESGQLERAALFQAATAVWEAFYGNAASARQRATAALELASGRGVDYAAAFALAVSGDVARSRALADDLARNLPEDTSVQYMWLPTLHALFYLNAGDAAAAIRSLQTASRFDLALGGLGFNFGALYPVYVRGMAYLAAQQPREAAAEFQKILDHRTIVLADPMGALARLQLARALVLTGETVKAKGVYNDLLALWKNADPGIPVVEQARAEYARLH